MHGPDRRLSFRRPAGGAAAGAGAGQPRSGIQPHSGIRLLSMHHDGGDRYLV